MLRLFLVLFCLSLFDLMFSMPSGPVSKLFQRKKRQVYPHQVSYSSGYYDPYQGYGSTHPYYSSNLLAAQQGYDYDWEWQNRCLNRMKSGDGACIYPWGYTGTTGYTGTRLYTGTTGYAGTTGYNSYYPATYTAGTAYLHPATAQTAYGYGHQAYNAGTLGTYYPYGTAYPYGYKKKKQ